MKKAWYLRSWKKDEWGKGVDAGKALDVTDLDFSKTFNMVSHCILVSKKELNGLDRQNTAWVKSWVDHWVQNVVAVVYSTWAKWQVAFLRYVSRSLFDIVTNDLHEDTIHLITSEDDTKMDMQLIHFRADQSFRDT